MPARHRLAAADLTPARLAGVHLVRAYDPARPGFEAWFRVADLASPDDTVRGLDVAVDATRVDEVAAAIRRASAPVGERRPAPG